MSKISLIGRNIRFIILYRIVTAVVSFFLFPFIVQKVGKEIYGVYLIVMTVTGYLGLLDFGIMSALNKYVSEYNGKNDRERMNKIINASLSFYVLIGIIIALLLFACAAYFDRFFKIDAANIRIVRQLFFAAGISALFVWPLSTFRGTVQGLNLWNLDAIVNIFIQISNALATYFWLSFGYGIVHLFLTSQILIALGSMVLYFVAKRNTKFELTFPYLEIDTFKFIFNYSFFMFLGSLIYVFIFQIHNVIIGHFISMSAVTVYAVAYNLQHYFRAINGTIGAPAGTIASEMEGRADYEGQRRLMFTGTKYMSAVFLPIILIMFFFAEPFITYWMGPGFEESIIPAKIIILFWLFNGTMELASGMLAAKGIVRQPLFIHVLVATTNMVIGISLIKIMGITAIALGLTVSMIFVGFPLIIRLSLRNLKVGIKEYFNKSIKRNLGLYTLVILLSFIVLNYIYPSNMYFTLLELGTIYSFSLGIYYLLILNKDEKREINKIIGIEKLINKLSYFKERNEIQREAGIK